MKHTRRDFLLWLGRGAGALGLGLMAGRILLADRSGAEYVQPHHRFGWQIDPSLCRQCGRCETACLRKPSAVKAVNDQDHCSRCVVCHGHILNANTPSDKIDAAERVCPRDALVRRSLDGTPDGYFSYTVDPDRCTGCGRCVALCGRLGRGSLFLVVRPDLCLGCQECAVARACPHGAVQRVPLLPAAARREDLPA